MGTFVGLVASRYSTDDILEIYPYPDGEDMRESLAYAAWRAEEIELPLVHSVLMKLLFLCPSGGDFRRFSPFSWSARQVQSLIRW